MIVRTTRAAKIFGSLVSGFPLILDDKYNVEWIALEFFIDSYRGGMTIGTLRTYAQHISDFLAQLRMDGIKPDDVSDPWLMAYKNEIRTRKNTTGKCNSENYATQVLRSTIAYLYWLESEEVIRGIVGESKHHPVRIERVGTGISHPLAIDKTKDKRKTITPRSDWINAIKQYGPTRPDLTKRFELMIDWGRTLGLRSAEICGLTVDLLPLRETAERAIIDKKNVFIRLRKTKGNKPATIPVSPLLIKKTWDYVDADRMIVVKKFQRYAKAHYSTYKVPDDIFLSDKTGVAIGPQSFSNAVRSAFLSAVKNGVLTIDERVWSHGLRHNFTANLLRKLDKMNAPRPEAIARQVTRHASVETMEPYMTDRFNEDFDG